MPLIYASFFVSVLEDVLLQMKLLTECSNQLRVIKTMTDMKQLLAMKYSIQQPAASDELKDVDPDRLWNEEYKLDKLVKDRNLVYNSILKTYRGLIANRSYNHLVEVNREIDEQKYYRETLVSEETKNKIIRRETAKQLRNQRNYQKTVLYDVNAVIDKLRVNIEDAALLSECRFRYITRWESARTSQNSHLIQGKEGPPLDAIMTYKKKLDDEQRVHYEIMLIINMSISETLEEVEKMMTKHDKDMEAVELAIQRKNIRYQDAIEKRIELEEIYKKHDELSKEWQSYKNEREMARLYRQKMHNAAYVVQAWWRGILVRNQLGPYKPKKKGKPKKK